MYLKFKINLLVNILFQINNDLLATKATVHI